MGSDTKKYSMWPQKGQRLFKETDKFYEFSHFGWGNIETQFYGYMIGYKDSADTLVDTAINSNNIKTLDTSIFPICFLYRQYLELAMKDIFLKYYGSTEEEKKKIIKNVSHNLLSIWKYIKTILSEDCSEEELNYIEIVESYIVQFNEIDKSSFTFRYPINKELDLLFTETKHLDLFNLKDRMTELFNFFEGCDCKLDSIRDYKFEMMSQYLSEVDY